MPGNKDVYRLYSADGHALIDLMQRQSEAPPEVGQRVLCRHPFQESKRAYVNPSRVESLYKVRLDRHLGNFIVYTQTNDNHFQINSTCRCIGRMEKSVERYQRSKRFAIMWSIRWIPYETITSARSIQRRTKSVSAMNYIGTCTICGWKMHRSVSLPDHYIPSIACKWYLYVMMRWRVTAELTHFQRSFVLFQSTRTKLKSSSFHSSCNMDIHMPIGQQAHKTRKSQQRHKRKESRREDINRDRSQPNFFFLLLQNGITCKWQVFLNNEIDKNINDGRKKYMIGIISCYFKCTVSAHCFVAHNNTNTLTH